MVMVMVGGRCGKGEIRTWECLLIHHYFINAVLEHAPASSNTHTRSLILKDPRC